MTNLKDKVSTICGIIIALSGSVLTLEKAGIALPAAVTTGSAIAGAVALAILGYLTGKNPDGSAKSPEQVAQQNLKP